MVEKLRQYLHITSICLAVSLLAGAEELRAQDASTVDSATVSITSNPIGGFIFLDGSNLELVTPADLRVPAGEHQVEVVMDGYEPLAKSLELKAGKHTRMQFVLISLPPIPVTAESLGLQRLPKIPEMDEKIAARLEEKWTNAAEMFAIVPLGQGILARLTLPKEHHDAANVMVIAGAGLTLSAYLVGKLLGKRKLKQIRARNEEIPGLNAENQRRNTEIDQIVEETNSSAVTFWMAENENRGKVTVTVD